MLCLVPDIKETYENIKIIFSLINLNSIPFKFVSDFKLLLIVNGQQTATSSFPCPFCFISLKELRITDETQVYLDYINTVTTENQNGDVLINDSKTLKTYGDLKHDFSRFCDDGKKRLNAKFYHSTINKPLFEEDDELCIIQKCVIPELHVLQGFVNHMFWDGLVPLLGREKALLWPKKNKLHYLQKRYHGNPMVCNLFFFGHKRAFSRPRRGTKPSQNM